jgi:circadian clock protein KaiB
MPARKTYILKLYVAGNTPNSMRALKTLRNILETEFRGVYALKVIDVLKNPQLAEEDKILATPTLAKILPPPVRRIIGDLSDRERVLIGLDLLYEELVDEGYGLEEPRPEPVGDSPKEQPLTDQQGDPMTSS